MTNLYTKFFKLLAQSDRIGGRFDKAIDIAKRTCPPEGGHPSDLGIYDGLAALTNKHPARGLECFSPGEAAPVGPENGFDQLDANRSAGRARMRAGMLYLFADKHAA